MELIGLKVKHAVFGAGTIAGKDGNYITIEFATKTSKFVYPDAFEKFIKAVDPAVQQAITDSIRDAKEAAEQKRQAEEAARKAAEEQLRATIAVAAPKLKKAKTLDEMFAPRGKTGQTAYSHLSTGGGSVRHLHFRIWQGHQSDR